MSHHHSKASIRREFHRRTDPAAYAYDQARKSRRICLANLRDGKAKLGDWTAQQIPELQDIEQLDNWIKDKDSVLLIHSTQTIKRIYRIHDDGITIMSGEFSEDLPVVDDDIFKGARKLPDDLRGKYWLAVVTTGNSEHPLEIHEVNAIAA